VKRNIRLILALFFIGAAFTVRLAAQTDKEPDSGGETTAVVIEDDTTEYYIRDFIFNITGMTRQFAIIYNAELSSGERITGRENLERYRRRKIQTLLNQRPLEYVDIQCLPGEAGEDGLVPVDLEITTRDSWNIIALPYPKYDDNTGFELTLKARDYNFLGTLSPLRIDFGYTLDQDKIWDFSEGSFNVVIDSDIPFNLFGFNWNLDFDNGVSYIYNEPIYYKNTTGLSMELPVGFTTATFGFEQNFILNERNEDLFRQIYGSYNEADYESAYGNYYEALYGISSVYNSWKIPTSLAVGNFGNLTYTPKISTGLAYGFNAGLDYLRQGYFITLSQKFGFSRIDWLDNYRDGMDVYIENPNMLNFSRNGWTGSSILFSATVHKKIVNFFGISGRLRYQHWLYRHKNWTDNNYSFTTLAGYNYGGDVLRGIFDRNLQPNYMLSFNLDFPLRVLGFLPSKWFETPKLRIIDFDLHVSPFIDMAFVRDPVHDIWFSDAPSVGGGFELIVFPHFFRSFYVRASLGYNMNNVIKNGKPDKWYGNELFIGIGHFY